MTVLWLNCFVAWKCAIKILHYIQNPNITSESQPIRCHSSKRVWYLALICGAGTNLQERLVASEQLSYQSEK